MTLVSVVVVTYNSSATVLETLESIYEQTYSPIELIISDDCSKDDTLIVIDKWIEEHKSKFVNTIVVKSTDNTGVTKNCNRGIFAARGKYVQLVAGDDLLLSNALEEKVAFAKRTGVKWVVSKTEPFGLAVESLQKMQAFCDRGYDIIAKGREEQVKQILFDNYIAGPSGGFYDMDFFRSFGGYDEHYPMLEDYPFIYHYLMAGNEIILLDKVLTRYRITGTSLCTSSTSPMQKSQRKFFFRERMWMLLKRGQVRFVIHKVCFYIYRATLKRLIYR